jgi:uncharacterized protein YraI
MRKLMLLFLCLLLTACNLPETDSDDDLADKAATYVAQTLTAQSPPTQENTPLPTATSAGTKSPTPTITPTYSTPMLKINEPTNCRTGPGQSFDILFTFNAGATVEIVGYYPTNNYWTVKVEGQDEPCWVWGEYATASGSTGAVPTVNPPPAPTASPPVAPSISSWDYLCGYSGSGPDVTFNLEWNDRADNENGYRIYRDDEVVTELPANSTTYSETIGVEEGEPITYWIEVFNSAGMSSTSKISFTCQ